MTVQPRPHHKPNNTPYRNLIRIKFLKFSGDDVTDWVYRCKKFFKYVKKYPDNTPWEHFKVEVVKRFGVLYDDPIVDLKNLKQTGSDQTYQEAFEALLNRVDLPELLVATSTILKSRYNTHLLSTPKQSTTYVSKAVTTPVKSNSVGQSSGYVTRNEDYVGDMVRVTDSPQITLDALSGLNSYETMRVRGRVGKQMVHILIDCSSTHNFLDIHTAKKLGCRLAKTISMQVSVANGQRMMSTSWLATLKDMQCNFKKLIMKFNHKGRQLVLRGMNNTHVHWMQGNERMLKQAELSSMALCVYPVQLCQMESVESVSAEVKQVLTQLMKFLKYGQGIDGFRGDQVSQSPFSYLIVMVKKKDGTWRMCIDYIQLNKHIVKEKFPIPVIEELIDELNGSVVFSKLDLRSGYHQIRMKEDDICKTTFRTHEGQYELLVMPFGLTISPLTFQSLMNRIFKAFRRKFVLVFFDDILIYSKNLEEHCDHLAQVLQVMKDNTLYAKRTKCYFDVPQVEYLGHIISAQGVSTDPSKIEAMHKWPIPSTLKQLRAFLSLTGYYRRFIKDYTSISRHLVALTKKDAFKWNPSAELAYHKLKEAMVKAPVLALPNFEQEFVVETDASDKGIEALLCQNADALSRMDYSGELLQISVSSASSGVSDKRKRKVVVGNDPKLRKELVQHFHDEAIGGHSGAHKPDLNAYPGLIKPLPIPERIWKEISMDFNEKLLTSHGKSVILVVVDRLSKYAHFIPLTHPFTASQVAQVFLNQVYKLHGLPESIILSLKSRFRVSEMVMSGTPVIDMQMVDGLAEEIVKACVEFGCFRVVNHGVSAELMAEMKVVVSSLFDLPEEIKRRTANPNEHGKGYIGRNRSTPFLEGFSIDEISDIINRYIKAIRDLNGVLGRKLMEGNGLNGDLFDGWCCHDEGVNGLQVVDKITGEFVPFDPVPGTLAVNIGDIGKAWSNGRYYNVNHRVLCFQPKTRYSIALFVLGPDDKLVEAPSKFVDSEHPGLYVPIDVEKFRHVRNTMGLRTGDALDLFSSTST
uniref:Gypsy/Ty3 retroelement polyprotein n=1 Tax=Tanacetum cinerariifolium TaxID=118510 RepID=A0A6L2J6K9_TANCI|nr:gypsy/Ty3 retroelement polyprotein [Tanacetum cinerariifolium]